MRKIKFRGKDVDSGNFVYGCLDLRGIHDCPSDALIIAEMNRGVWYVNRDTVGEFIGMYDCDGVEVYEGDICELMNFEGNHKFIVKWDAERTGFSMFCLNGEKSSVQFHGNASKNLKVVGNIFDNKEWLIAKNERRESD